MNELGQYAGWIVAALVGVIAVLVAVLRRSPAPATPEPSPEQKKQDAVVEQVRAQAETDREVAKAEALTEQQKKTAELLAEQRRNLDALGDDPEAINNYLKDVGSKVR